MCQKVKEEQKIFSLLRPIKSFKQTFKPLKYLRRFSDALHQDGDRAEASAPQDWDGAADENDKLEDNSDSRQHQVERGVLGSALKEGGAILCKVNLREL